MTKIEFGEVHINPESRKHIDECLNANWITQGKKVQLFEQKFAQILQYPYCRLLSSGTTADTAACILLYEYGAEIGDEIICPALSFIATANSIRMAGFVPRFVDVKRETLNIDEDLIYTAITPKTRAIMAVNLMGRPCQLDYLKEIADRYSLFLIIDNCEAYGSEYKGKHSLEYADIETTSHYTAHIIPSAEGGCVFTKEKEHDEIIEAIRSHGRVGGTLYFDHPIFGANFKNTDLHASIGLGSIDNFWDIFHRRRENVIKIRNAIGSYRDLAFFSEEDKDNVNAPHGFSLVFKNFNNAIKFREDMNDANIHLKRNFGCMATQHKCFKYLDYKLGDFPEAEYVGDHGFHFGVHEYLSEDDISYIIEKVSNSLKGMTK